mmetsp:Transcript_31188/g.90039  ORF Transcript_31188/g.90039 Transcript_31188/m.90039 type:complete len:209 (-) Transcript_31188:446-1072(-)
MLPDAREVSGGIAAPGADKAVECCALHQALGLVHNAHAVVDTNRAMVETLRDVQCLTGTLDALPRGRREVAASTALAQPLCEGLKARKAASRHLAGRIHSPPLPAVQLQVVGVPVDVEGHALARAAQGEGQRRTSDPCLAACDFARGVAGPIVESAQGFKTRQRLPTLVQASLPHETAVVEEIALPRDRRDVVLQNLSGARFLLAIPH